MIITQIEPLHNKKRKVYIDYEYAFPLYVSDIRKYKLCEESLIEKDIYNEICNLVVGRISRRIAYLITDYDKSEHDIRNKLIMASYPEILIDMAIDKLKGYGYIDDARYARTYAGSLADRNKSPLYIRMKLKEKGISADIINLVMYDMTFDESAQIGRLLEKKGLNVRDVNNMDYDSKRKLYGYFMRQGFSMSTIKNFFSDEYY